MYKLWAKVTEFTLKKTKLFKTFDKEELHITNYNDLDIR